MESDSCPCAPLTDKERIRDAERRASTAWLVSVLTAAGLACLLVRLVSNGTLKLTDG